MLVAFGTLNMFTSRTCRSSVWRVDSTAVVTMGNVTRAFCPAVRINSNARRSTGSTDEEEGDEDEEEEEDRDVFASACVPLGATVIVRNNASPSPGPVLRPLSFASSFDSPPAPSAPAAPAAAAVPFVSRPVRLARRSTWVIPRCSNGKGEERVTQQCDDRYTGVRRCQRKR